MRAIYSLLLAIICHIILNGCDDHIYYSSIGMIPSTEELWLSISKNSYTFESSGGTQEIGVGSVKSWSFTDIPDWLSVSALSGDGNGNGDYLYYSGYDDYVTLTAEPNTSFTNRDAIFFVESQGKDLTLQIPITATQSGESPFITLSEDSKTLSGIAQSISIAVETNIDDSDIETEVSEYWATASYSNKQLTVTVETNMSTYSRSTKIYLRHTNSYNSDYIHITQLAPNVDIDNIYSIDFNADGNVITTGKDSYPVQIDSEIAWHASTESNWILITPASGNGGATETAKISVLPSTQSTSRSGYVYFYADNRTSAIRSIRIEQEGRHLYVSPTAIIITAEGTATKSITIDSDIEWKVESKPEWINLDSNQGNKGKSTISVSASKNRSTNSRTDDIVICDAKGIGLSRTVTVTQSGIDFGDVSKLEFNWQKSSQTIRIPFSNYWNAAVSNGWIELSKYQGSGEDEITVSVSRNDLDDARTGQITFTSEGHSFNVNIVQSGQYLHLNSEAGKFNAMGGTSQLSVSSTISTEWSISYPADNADWIAVDDSKENTYKFSVSYNPSINVREAEFILLPIDDDVAEIYRQGVKYHISQTGRSLTCDVYQLDMFDAGGTSDTFEIKSDGAYSITKDEADTWYTIVHNADFHTFYIVATENTTTDTRTGKIKISLSELPNGEEFTHEIVVRQYCKGINIKFNDYEDEEIW